MKTKAIYPGSFNPFHAGHFAIAGKATRVFDKIIILVASNPNKNQLVPLKKRAEWIKTIVKLQENWKGKVKVDFTERPIYEYCYDNNITHIVKGLRNSADFEYEKVQSQMNDSLINLKCKGINDFRSLETVFFTSDGLLEDISSSIIRELTQVTDSEQFCRFARRYFPLFRYTVDTEYLPKMLTEIYELYK